MADIKKNQPKTYYDIGIAPHRQYETGIPEDARRDLENASYKIKEDVGYDNLSPSLYSKVNILFGREKKGPMWGNIPPPPSYNRQTGRLYTSQIGPGLGPDDRIQTMQARVDGKKEDLLAQLSKAPPSAIIEEKKATVRNDADKVQSLLLTLSEINKGLEFINGERSRFKKG